jgi:two-component system response regulator YesN
MSAPDARPIGGSMLNIAIVDDEDRIRRGIEKVLERIDVPNRLIGSFGSSLDAFATIASLTDGKLDVVITDIRMPEMDGLQLVCRLRRIHPGLKFIILSGHGNFEYARQAMRYGVIEYMLKPVDVKELEGILQKFDHEEYRQVPEQGAEEPSDPTQSAGASCEHIVHRVVRQVKTLIESQYQRDLSLQELADTVNFSPSHLSRLFHREEGITITDYTTQVRMSKSQQLLEFHPELKVFEVAHMVGYDTPEYFNRQFKKTYGVTPKEFKDLRR